MLISDKERLNQMEHDYRNAFPIDIDCLLDYAKEQAEQMENLKNAFDDLDSDYIDLVKQNERYREALEFYSKRDNYEPKHFDPNIVEYMSVIDYDEGEEARKTLRVDM